MRKKILLLILLASIGFRYCNAQKAADRIPYTIAADFETGELFGWEPYPYAEDIGSYRLVFAQKSPTHNDSKYALAGLVRANDVVEVYEGFTRRFDLWTVQGSRVRIAVYFQSDRNPATLELSLGTFQGKRYFCTLKNPRANHWLELDLPIDSFRLNGQPLAANEHIQVITVTATYPSAYWLNTYTILLDDFTINGERERRFTAIEPASTSLDMFGTSTLNKHFFYGDTLALALVPEGHIALDQLRGVLIDSKGKVVKDNIDFRQQNNQWINNTIYKLPEKDVTGQWEIRLTGRTKAGAEVRGGFHFLMPGNHLSGHPRLFFSAAELKDRLANEKSPVAKKILSRALENNGFLRVNIDSVKEGPDYTAESLVGGPYGKYSAGFNSGGEWLNPMKTLQDVIQEGSFRYAFTKDAVAGEKAKKALLRLCSFSKWNNNFMLEHKFWSYYPVGFVLTSVSYGYDMLNDLLTEKEKKLVRDAIMEKGIKLFYRDMVEMNRMPSNITNHIAVLVSGCLLAATAIYGDDPQNPNMEPYLSGIITKAKAFIDNTYYKDGSYVEPKTGYMNMATRAIVELLAVLERNFGVDYSTTTNVETFYKYPLYATDSTGTMQDFGDGNTSFKAFTEIHSEWFVHRTGNPFLYNYIKPYWEAGNGGYIGYLWYRNDITPVSRETLPSSKTFSAQGMVMRSGWKEASTVISTHVGPHGNHAHFDQGSFQIMTNGEELLTDPGIGPGGYYRNLEYMAYNVQSIAHNVMLVDHDPESQLPADFNTGIAALSTWPQTKNTFTGELADAIETDLTCVYKDKLDAYTRTILYTKSGPLFLFDKVKSKSPQGNSFSWLFHAPQKELSNTLPNYTGWLDKKDAGVKLSSEEKGRKASNVNAFNYAGRRLIVNQAKARLTMDVIAPEIASSSINDKISESYISLNSLPNTRETSFLAVILPEAKPQSGDYDPRPVTTRVEAPGWIGAKMERLAGTDLGCFRTSATAGSGEIEGFGTDADRFTASFNPSGKLLKVYFEGSHFSGKGISVKSSLPLTCAIAADSSETRMEVQTVAMTQLQVSFRQRPSRVILNGTPVKAWKYDNHEGIVSLQVPAGRYNVLVK
jgi:hypothetical protein